MIFSFAFCFLVLSLFVQLLRTRYKRYLSKIPGPYLASVSNLWKVCAVYQDDMPRKNVEAHEKYGPVVRIGPDHVSFASPEALKTIYTSRPSFAKVKFEHSKISMLALIVFCSRISTKQPALCTMGLAFSISSRSQMSVIIAR